MSCLLILVGLSLVTFLNLKAFNLHNEALIVSFSHLLLTFYSFPFFLFPRSTQNRTSTCLTFLFSIFYLLVNK